MESSEEPKEYRSLRSVVGYLLVGAGAVLMIGGLIAIFLSGTSAYRAGKGYEPYWKGLGFGMLAAVPGFVMVRLGRYALPKDKKSTVRA